MVDVGHTQFNHPYVQELRLCPPLINSLVSINIRPFPKAFGIEIASFLDQASFRTQSYCLSLCSTGAMSVRPCSVGLWFCNTLYPMFLSSCGSILLALDRWHGSDLAVFEMVPQASTGRTRTWACSEDIKALVLTVQCSLISWCSSPTSVSGCFVVRSLSFCYFHLKVFRKPWNLVHRWKTNVDFIVGICLSKKAQTVK